MHVSHLCGDAEKYHFVFWMILWPFLHFLNAWVSFSFPFLSLLPLSQSQKSFSIFASRALSSSPQPPCSSLPLIEGEEGGIVGGVDEGEEKEQHINQFILS